MIIKDADGQSLKINDEGRLMAEASCWDHVAKVSDYQQESYSWAVSYDYDAGDVVLCIRNDDRDKHLHIACLALGATANTLVTVYCPETIAVGDGAEIEPVNLNRGSSNEANATAYRDGTAAEANYVFYLRLIANIPFTANCYGALILEYNDCFAIKYATNADNGVATVWGFFENPHS